MGKAGTKTLMDDQQLDASARTAKTARRYANPDAFCFSDTTLFHTRCSHDMKCGEAHWLAARADSLDSHRVTPELNGVKVYVI